MNNKNKTNDNWIIPDLYNVPQSWVDDTRISVLKLNREIRGWGVRDTNYVPKTWIDTNYVPKTWIDNNKEKTG
ncbi:MAG: hypothetical protein E7271_03630 [Lachnospiraceae bacterium]|jgi:hypothetical protein|nr:hypothetical protein [Lachnospiraceae bacterium]